MRTLKEDSELGKILNELEQWLKAHDLKIAAGYEMNIEFTYKDKYVVANKDVECGDIPESFPRRFDSERFIVVEGFEHEK